jgi:hypothetical protein
MSVEPTRYTFAFGKAFVDQLTAATADRAVLRIGRDRYSIHDVATRLGVVHTKACRSLTRYCDANKIASAVDLYKKTTPYAFASEHGIGLCTLYVVFAVFQDKDLHIDAWFAKGQEGARVSFLALKHRELVAERRAKADDKKRARGKRSKAHESHVEQFLATARA